MYFMRTIYEVYANIVLAILKIDKLNARQVKFKVRGTDAFFLIYLLQFSRNRMFIIIGCNIISGFCLSGNAIYGLRKRSGLYRV